MKYVKLTARPNTWFKAGTEVYTYESRQDSPTRMTLEEWERWMDPNPFVVLVAGLRVCDDDPNECGLGYAPGEERWDGESCDPAEFDMEIVEEPR